MSGPPPPDNPPLHAFRLLRGQILIDLPFQPHAVSTVRVATLWPNAGDPRGWAHAPWEPAGYGRGFRPGPVELGDVVGFIAESRPPARALPTAIPTSFQDQPALTRHLTWYGYLHEISDLHLLLRGPYPQPLAAYTAAQRALIATLDQQNTGREPVLPASPPLTTSITHTAEHSTVGDIHHGWIRVPARLLTHALMQPVDQLRHRLATRAPYLLTGHEPPITLAALAARHLADQLHEPLFVPPTPLPAPPGPDVSSPPPAAPEPDPEPDSPNAADEPSTTNAASSHTTAVPSSGPDTHGTPEAPGPGASPSASTAADLPDTSPADAIPGFEPP
ncbi:hypothetical protein MXD59_19055 [Frankia sp. Ag45/Mut15]|uniref:Uncharacterized protein n=1 Tax=Frankia umida TaxID=573489 RepID=A0ABT0K240_9ACTN|nr:hypothetical protein [Frankia umida]MCK9877849.1 hypothetical protein [Frankia umida]